MSSAPRSLQDHVGPALAARRPVVEFAEQRALLGLLGEFAARSPAVVSRSQRPNSRSRSRSSTIGWPRRRRSRRRPRRSPWRSGGRGHRARRGRSRASRLRAEPANQRPSASAWRSPSGLSGTSTSRSSRSITAGRPRRRRRARHCRRSGRGARSRAFRAIFASSPRQSASPRESSDQAFRLAAARRRSAASMKRCARMPTARARVDIDLAVVDEQGVGRAQPEAVERRARRSRDRASAA